MDGIIVKWFEERGYGFIQDESGRNIFFHYTNCKDSVKIDDEVTFDLYEVGENKWIARNVKLNRSSR